MGPERWASLSSIEIPINLVLVVEDDVDSAEMMRAILERQGLKVRVAKEGGQAQATFVMQKPDFVILDLILPGESGYEICERLKHTDDSVPILIVTAIDLQDSRDLAERVGADGYMTKPYEPEFLLAKMQEVAKRVWERNHLDQEPRSDASAVQLFLRQEIQSQFVPQGKEHDLPSVRRATHGSQVRDQDYVQATLHL